MLSTLDSATALSSARNNPFISEGISTVDGGNTFIKGGTLNSQIHQPTYCPAGKGKSQISWLLICVEIKCFVPHL